MSINLFNAAYYSAVNPDLAAAGLTTFEQLLSHLQNFGLNEGRAFSPVVNLRFYQQNSPDLAASGLTTNRQLYEHLQNFGVAEGRRFSPLVDLDFYLVKNSDVLQAFAGNPERAFEHLQNFGIAEGRKFSPLVNLEFYLAANPDLEKAFGRDRIKALEHLATLGFAENRRFSPVFDPNHYRQAYPDLAAANLNHQQLLEHFETYGLNEGRRSSETFDIRYYLDANPDLKTAGFNYQQALQHALLFGWREGRPSSQGHALSEPILLWSQPSKKITFPTFSEGFRDIRLNPSGNLTLIRVFARLTTTFSLEKYDSLTGQYLWSNNLPQYWDITFDSAENTYLTGNKGVDSEFVGFPIYRTLISKYDSSNNLLWQQELQTIDAPNQPLSSKIAVDTGGNVYVAGETTTNLGGTNAGEKDIFIVKYDRNGNQQWLKQIGTTGDEIPSSVAVDSAGNLYVTGSTTGNLGGNNPGNQDIWVAKYDSLTGNQVWMQQFGTGNSETSERILVDSSGHVYIAGNTDSDLGGKNAGGLDIWLSQYDANTGTQQFLQQFGTQNADYLIDLGLNPTGGAYVMMSTVDGSTRGLTKYNSSGSREWFLPIATTDFISDVALDSGGSIYAVGSTSTPDNSALLAKYSLSYNFF